MGAHGRDAAARGRTRAEWRSVALVDSACRSGARGLRLAECGSASARVVRARKLIERREPRAGTGCPRRRRLDATVAEPERARTPLISQCAAPRRLGAPSTRSNEGNSGPAVRRQLSQRGGVSCGERGMGCPHRPVLGLRPARFLPPPIFRARPFGPARGKGEAVARATASHMDGDSRHV